MTAARLILASASEARQTMLRRAGVDHVVHPSSVDEDIIKRDAGNMPPDQLACDLAKAKACAVSATFPNDYVLGADQVLVFDDKVFDKPADLTEARANLLTFRGAAHRLIAAMAIVRDGAIVWHHTDTATLYMRNFSDAFLDAYLHTEGERVLGSVGAYRVEGSGLQLFERIEGCHETVLGLPLLPLLDELRRLDLLET